jgi:protein MPE1
MPPAKPGKGRAAIYVAGNTATVPSDRRLDSKPLPSAMSAWGRPAGGSMSRRFDGKEDKTNTPPADLTTPADDEAARIKAMFQANAEHWEETQERMSQSVLSSGLCSVVP